jgi:hypothetical protein
MRKFKESRTAGRTQRVIQFPKQKSSLKTVASASDAPYPKGDDKQHLEIILSISRYSEEHIYLSSLPGRVGTTYDMVYHSRGVVMMDDNMRLCGDWASDLRTQSFLILDLHWHVIDIKP